MESTLTRTEDPMQDALDAMMDEAINPFDWWVSTTYDGAVAKTWRSASSARHALNLFQSEVLNLIVSGAQGDVTLMRVSAGKVRDEAEVRANCIVRLPN